MKPLLVALPLLVAGLSSCDKAKQAVVAARDKITGTTDTGAPLQPGGELDPALASQVDSAAEGVRFRRDLPFPNEVKVRVIERRVYKNVRVSSRSALGNEIASYSGTWEDVVSLDLKGGAVSISLEKSGEVIDLPKGADSKGAAKTDDASLPSAATGTVGTRLRFLPDADGWKVPETKGPVEFGKMVLEQELLPVLPVLLSTNGVQPRSQWFSPSRRWIGGDKFELEGESMALLFPGKSEGKLTLTYEASEALDGHPCGRFSVQGDVTLLDDVSLTGESGKTELTIHSGKIWCSLIHPLVLREDFEIVETSEYGSGKGNSLRVQGAVHQVIAREWGP